MAAWRKCRRSDGGDKVTASALRCHGRAVIRRLKFPKVMIERKVLHNPKTNNPKTRAPKTSDPETRDAKTSDPKTRDPKISDPKEAEVQEAGVQEARVQEAGVQEARVQEAGIQDVRIQGAVIQKQILETPLSWQVKCKSRGAAWRKREHTYAPSELEF